MLAPTELLQPTATQPVWLRVTTATKTLIFGIGEGLAGRKTAELLLNEIGSKTDSFPISGPTVSGATVVIDVRVRRTMTAGELQAQYLKNFPWLDFVTLERLNRANLSTAANVPAARVETAAAAETVRVANRVTLGQAVQNVVDVAKFTRGAFLLGLIAVMLFFAAPFLKSAGIAAKRLAK